MEYLGYSIPLLIIALVGLCNTVGFPRKYSALLAVGFGIVIETLFVNTSDVRNSIFMGIVIGLSASGLYSGAKNIMQANSTNKNGNGTSFNS